MRPSRRHPFPIRLPLVPLITVVTLLALATACGDGTGEAGAGDAAAPGEREPSAETVTGPTDPGAQALAEGVWILTHLSGEAVTLPEGWDEPPHLAWDPMEAAAMGSGGCNQFGGIGFVQEGRFSVQGIAATRRFCEGLMEVEEAFFAALSQGGRLIPEGDILRLLELHEETGEEGPELARFRRG